jgi:hypothetical protein
MFVDRVSTWHWDMRKKKEVARTLPRRLQQSISIVSLWQKSRGTACSSANEWNKKDDFDPELDLVKLLLIIFVVTVPIILNTSNRKEVLRIEEKIQLKPLIYMSWPKNLPPRPTE